MPGVNGVPSQACILRSCSDDMNFRDKFEERGYGIFLLICTGY